MPSQQQVRWSQLRVGITVIIAVITLGVLIIMMSGSGGLFTKTITLKSYFENTGGLRVGSLVSLSGVNVGNVTDIKVIPGRAFTPVEVTMRLGTKYSDSIKKDSKVSLATAGFLGDLYLDITSKNAKGLQATDGDILVSEDHPDINDMIKTGQGALSNADVLLKRVDRIVSDIEKGQGTVGMLIKDPTMYNRVNETLNELKTTLNNINQGKGTVGKLIKDDEMYRKVMQSVDKINKMVDEIDQGKGNIGKMVKDEQLYKNANESIAKINKLLEDVNAGKGALGKFAHDEEFAKKLDSTVSNLSSLTHRMDEGEGSVGKLFRDPSLYNNADQLLVEARSLVKSMRENPKKYLTIHVKLF